MFGKTGNSMRGGTTGNEGPYITFQDLGTLPPASSSKPRGTKSQLIAHSGSYDLNGSEELILPHGKIMKKTEIAVTYKNSS